MIKIIIGRNYIWNTSITCSTPNVHCGTLPSQVMEIIFRVKKLKSVMIHFEALKEAALKLTTFENEFFSPETIKVPGFRIVFLTMNFNDSFHVGSSVKKKDIILII